jgi:hypothetical protein
LAGMITPEGRDWLAGFAFGASHDESLNSRTV